MCSTCTAPSSRLEDVLASQCYRRAVRSFTKSKIAADLVTFVNLARRVELLGLALAEALPKSKVAGEWMDGNQMARDIRAGVWGVGIAADLLDSELPGAVKGLAKGITKMKQRAKAKKNKKTKSAPAAGFSLPHFGTLDLRTPEEKAADDLAGIKLTPPRIPGTNGKPKPQPKPRRQEHALTNRLAGLTG